MKKISMSFILAFMLTGTAFAADYSLPSYTFPDTDIPFMNRTKQLFADTAGKDFSGLFSAPLLADQSACGYSKDDVKKILSSGYEEYLDSKNMTKMAKRNTGMDMQFDVTENIEPQFVSYICPTDTEGGEITFRYSTKTDSVVGTYEMHTSADNISTMYLKPKNEPDYIRTLHYTTTTGSLASPPMFTSDYRDIKTGEMVTAMKINGNTTVVDAVQLGDKKTRQTAWQNGALLSITNMKKGLMHGTFEIKDMKTKIFGKEYLTPGFIKCYRNGVELKTTGECNVD